MLLVFCGTPRFAVPTLEKLVSAGHSVPLVVTQPDRPRGRGMEVAVSPVKEAGPRPAHAAPAPRRLKNKAEPLPRPPFRRHDDSHPPPAEPRQRPARRLH